jgi:thioredoxin reductase (NADPH)
MKTNIDRVYAAGDIIGGVRQIVSAVCEGATAALASLKDLGKQYPF